MCRRSVGGTLAETLTTGGVVMDDELTIVPWTGWRLGVAWTLYGVFIALCWWAVLWVVL
jgi:hypothetical protein